MDDLISRQAALDAISCDITVTGRQNAELVAATIGAFADRIKALPSVQPEILASGEGELNVPDTDVEDMISRQAAIDLLKQMRKDGDMVPWEGKNVFARIRKLPSAQADVPDIHVGKWIPVSERLPEHGGYYIVTEMISEESWFVGVVLYRGTCERWFTDYEVTAWMPLPEPWKGEGWKRQRQSNC